MSFLRALSRSVQVAGYFVRYGTELLVKRPQTREARADWLHRFCAAALKGLEIDVVVVGSFPARGVGDLESFELCRYCGVCGCASVCLRIEGGGRIGARTWVDDYDGGNGLCRAGTGRVCDKGT